jgi:N-methylhydantoinase B
MSATETTESLVTPDGVIRHAQADHDRLPEGPWDGRKYSYIPRYPLPMDPGVQLHQDFDAEIDPITYQVLRSRFWHQNLEHGDVLQRVSGSLVVVESLDFATSILTEDGDVVVVGPTIQYFAVQSDLVIKWTLEHRGAQGFKDGDIFLQNDPFISTAQQADTALYAPVFWEGRIFCWIYNMSHIGDLGGVDPGGWSINARDIYDEAIGMPPFKIAREGEVQQDLVEAFSRQSRDPTMIVLGIKGAIAGIEATRRQVLATLERYGPGVVKGTMRKMIADASKVVAERLQRIPDGTWSERIYVTGVSGDDRLSHKEVITLTKRGDRVTVTNDGTSPQAGPGNSPYTILRASVVSALTTGLAFDQQGCAGGVANHVMFEPVPGTRNVPTHPAAVSGILSTMLTVNLAGVVVSKMLMCAPPDIRTHANASGAMAIPLANFTVGITERGDHVGVDAVAGGAMNPLAGGFGAFPHRDGVDTGGSWWLMNTTAGNAEEMEKVGVVVAVYRIEKTDSGGPGRWRGGNGISMAIMKHKIFSAVAQFAYTDPSANTSIGLGGGYYGLGGNYLRVPKVDEMFAAGKMVSRREDFEAATGGELERLHPRAIIFPLPEGDCLITEYNGGGGFGDPLLREPERVALDVADLRVSRGAADRHWGVVLDEEGAVDEVATGRRREEIRAGRLDGAKLPAAGSLGRAEGAEVLIDGAGGSVDVVASEDGAVWACTECAELLGPATATFKHACAQLERKPQEVDALMYADPATFGDAGIVLRQYSCPGCGTLLSQEFCHTEDEPYADFSLEAADAR